MTKLYKYVKPSRLKEISDVSYGESPVGSMEGMVRTQIYLTQAEHVFLQKEAKNKGITMAAFLRQMIDDKMEIREDIWLDNPLLSTPVEEDASAPEDASIHLDHYLYGLPKTQEKIKGKRQPIKT
jgi:hypothetical protein